MLRALPALLVCACAPCPELLLEDSFDGGLAQWEHRWGEATVQNGQAVLWEDPPEPGTTESTLLMSHDRDWGDYELELDFVTDEQLRWDEEPNNWEVAWVLWRVQDHYNFYYALLKPTGIEFGKKHGASHEAQTFLSTPDVGPNMELGRWYHMKVRVEGDRSIIWVDGEQLVDCRDDSHPCREGDPSDTAPFLHGGVGLYHEDARVRFDDVVVTRIGGCE
jgi:hypothetical protein